ncbi:MAG: hypothetical protein KAI70_01090 [Candidatus Omnitrophica bacterium]|nr:hypothetical protein [Candidatus Omnitrophota bacterium]
MGTVLEKVEKVRKWLVAGMLGMRSGMIRIFRGWFGGRRFACVLDM